MARSEGRPRVACLPSSKMDGSGDGGGRPGGARGAPLAFPGAAGTVEESRGLPPPSGREAGGGGAAAAPETSPGGGGGGPASSLLAQPGGHARGPRRHGRGSRVAAAAGGGPQQGEALAALGPRAGRLRRSPRPYAPCPGSREGLAGAGAGDAGARARRGKLLKLLGGDLAVHARSALQQTTELETAPQPLQNTGEIQSSQVSGVCLLQLQKRSVRRSGRECCRF